MFKVPEWGEDIPKSNTSFEKKIKKKQKSSAQNTKSIKPTPKIENDVAKKKYSDSTPKTNKPVHKDNHSRVNKPSPRVYPKPTSRINNSTPRLNNQTSKVSSGNKRIRISNKNGPTDKNNIKRKRKLEETPIEKKQKRVTKSKKGIDEAEIFNTDIPDEVLIHAKRRKLNEALQNDDREELLFKETVKSSLNNDDSSFMHNGSNKVNYRKEKLKKILSSNRAPINVTGNKLRQRMLERLKAAQFRYLNEKLYTSSGSEAQQLFQNDPSAFQTYHQGYQLQVKKWPVNPLDVIVKRILKMPKTCTIADMGCGEAALRRRVPHTVRSFDLVATAEGVEECDMGHTPLLTSSMDVAVYCLALMGTQLTQYLIEANRVLKMGGHLLIAEVESRFDKVDTFTSDVQRLGFKLKNLDKSHKVFFFMEFVKIRDPPAKKAKIPDLTLKPCLYKRR